MCNLLYHQTLQEEAVQYKARLDLLIGLSKVIVTMTTTSNKSADGTQSPMEQELESALTRYDDIWRGMEARRIIVETTLLQIERYRKMIRNITIVLYKVEKKVSKVEPIGGDLETIQKQLLEHKVINHF